MATEAQVSKAIVIGLQLCGHFAWKSSDKYTVGIADILGTFSVLKSLASGMVNRSFLWMVQPYAGRTIAIETKLVKAWPKQLSSKVLQHELSRAQFKFLESVSDRGGLAYVALAGPAKVSGVSVWLVPFDVWDAGSEQLEGKNITMGWLVDQPNARVPLMRGNLSKGLLASAGPLEASFR